jgi:hypothetical protein
MKNAMRFQRALAGLLAGGMLAGGALAFAGPASAAGPLGGGKGRAASTAPTTAQTCSATELSAAQALVGKGLSARVAILGALSADVSGAKYLTPGDRSTLATDISNEQAGVAALQAKVPTDTTCAEVKADGQSMVLDYRVYVVMAPQVHLTVAADTESAVVTLAENTIEPKVKAAITAAVAKGETVSAAQSAFATAQAQLATAQSASTGVSATVLSFTPASFPGCKTTFVSEKTGLQGGQAALQKADADLKVIISTLKTAKKG